MITASLRTTSTFPALSRSPAPTPRQYTLADLGQHPDGAPLLPVALNGQLEICASAPSLLADGMVRGVRVNGPACLPVGIAYGQSPVTSISESGQLAGVAGATAGKLRAWASHLGNFGDEFWPDSVSISRGINSAGHVTGNVLFDMGDIALSRAFVLTAPDRARFVTPPRGGTTVAAGINDAGDVVFNAAPLGAPAGETFAWCLRGDRYLPIGSLGGARTWATAVTPDGRVVGHSLTPRGETHAILWEDGYTLDLGAPPGAMSQALAANDRRVVVGRVIDAETGLRAFRWTPDSGFMLLEDIVALPPGWRLLEAIGVNRSGVIVGIGTWGDEPRGFVLSPES
jgi:probable HAF family extracellular repeat protein